MTAVHWMQVNPPHAAAWGAIAEAVRFDGLTHGMSALPHMVGNYSPADVANLLAVMVEQRVIEPVALDVAGAGASVRAFRGIGPSAGGQPAKTWSKTDAHFWTYRAARAVAADQPKPGEQLELLNWKEHIEREHHENEAGTRTLGEVRRDGRDGLSRETVHREHRPEAQPSALGEDGGLGTRAAFQHSNLGPLPGAPEAREETRCDDQGGARGEEESAPREADNACTAEAAEEAAQAEELRRAGVLTLGGLRPGSRYLVIPSRHQLWWKPCLTRDPDTGREHCWFLAPTSLATFFCKACVHRRANPTQIARAA